MGSGGFCRSLSTFRIQITKISSSYAGDIGWGLGFGGVAVETCTL